MRADQGLEQPATTDTDVPLRSLAELPPGVRATIVEVDGGSSPVARRLADLGFTPGAVVEVVRRAPLRDPVLFRVKDYEICLRRAQAGFVRAAVLDGPVPLSEAS